MAGERGLSSDRSADATVEAARTTADDTKAANAKAYDTAQEKGGRPRRANASGPNDISFKGAEMPVAILMTKSVRH